MSDTPTPRTDAESTRLLDSDWPDCNKYGIMRDFASQLERELAAALKDKDRLDWLEKQSNGTGWIARISSTGRGYRLHNTNGGLSYATAREAIDAAMNSQ